MKMGAPWRGTEPLPQKMTYRQAKWRKQFSLGVSVGPRRQRFMPKAVTNSREMGSGTFWNIKPYIYIPAPFISLSFTCEWDEYTSKATTSKILIDYYKLSIQLRA